MSSKWTEKEIDMIDEMVNREVDMMDMEGLIEYARDQLWKWFDNKTDEEIKGLYEDYKSDVDL
tara:strand:+ start:271 stop:459 length:189 start_codon:yes stop_codon:yes gene_type:complete